MSNKQPQVSCTEYVKLPTFSLQCSVIMIICCLVNNQLEGQEKETLNAIGSDSPCIYDRYKTKSLQKRFQNGLKTSVLTYIDLKVIELFCFNKEF